MYAWFHVQIDLLKYVTLYFKVALLTVSIDFLLNMKTMFRNYLPENSSSHIKGDSRKQSFLKIKVAVQQTLD